MISISFTEKEIRLIDTALEEKLDRILGKQYAFGVVGSDEEIACIELRGKIYDACLDNEDEEE